MTKDKPLGTFVCRTKHQRGVITILIDHYNLNGHCEFEITGDGGTDEDRLAVAVSILQDMYKTKNGIQILSIDGVEPS